MLLGGGSSCQGCGCKSCQACTRTCTNPHTGDPFEVVYTLYSGLVGAEVGNPTDGYLTATGDSDTDDPQDGMDGTGPWYQQITGTFSIAGNGITRYPCSFPISFWRSTYHLGSLTPGQPQSSDALTKNEIKITNNGPGDIGDPSTGDVYLAAGQSITISGQIPLVLGTGDKSGSDPRKSIGTVWLRALCQNVPTEVAVTARLEWNVKQRQHLLYGVVRECYETGSPCATSCAGGTAAPSAVYVTISNYSGPTYDGGVPMDVNGTYVLDRQVGFCQFYGTTWTAGICTSVANPLGSAVWAPIHINGWGQAGSGVAQPGFFMAHYAPIGGACQGMALYTGDSSYSICGTGVLYSGTNGIVRVGLTTTYTNAFDWKIEV